MAQTDVGIRLSLEGGRQVEQGLQSVAQGASKVASTLAGLAGGFGAIQFATKLVDVQREFDVLNSSLVTVTGSSAQAAKEFDWIRQFASTTPFQLNEVTNAFIKMKSLGLDATQGALASYGNTASAMGKTLNQMIEAVADASTGEFERLKEFGIKASKSGDQVSLTFQGITKTIGNSAADITKYLQDIGNINFSGAMEERAKTLDGAISNLADNWDGLFLTISQKNAGSLMADSVTLASGAINDVITILKSLDSATQNSANSTGALAVAQEALAVTFEAVAVAAVQSKYILTSVGREIGGLIAQFSALGEGGGIFSAEGRAAWSAVGQAMREDAEAARKDVDSTTAAILLARQNAANATEVNTQASARLARQSTETATAVAAHTTATTANAAAAKKAAAEAEKAYKTHYDLVMSQIQAANRLIDVRNKEAAGIEDFITAQRLQNVEAANAAEAAVRAAQDEFDNHGKLQSEIAATTLKRLEDQLVNKTAGTEAYESIARQIEAQKKLISIMRNGEIRDASEQAAKDAKAEWDKYADQIGQSLTDQLMQGGKSAADYIRDLFRTMVLRPVVQGVVQAGLGAVGLGAAGAASAGQSTLGGATSSLIGSSISSLIPASFTTFGNAALAGVQSMVGMVGTTAQAATAAANGLAYGATGAGSTAAGLGAQFAAAAPYLGAALLAYMVINGNNTKSAADSGRARIDYNPAGVGGEVYSTTGDAAQIANMAIATNGLAKSYFDTAKALGIEAIKGAFEVGTNTGKQGENPQTVLGASFGSKSFSSGEFSSTDAAAYSLAASRAVLTALQASELPGYLAQVFNDITASTATQDQINGALQYAGALKTIRAALLETREPLEIVQDNVAAAIASLGTSADTFKTDFVAAIDAGISPDKLAAWQALGTGLDQLKTIADETAKATTEAAKALAKVNQGWQDQLDVLLGTQTERGITLRDATDDSTRALMRQVYAQQDLKNATDSTVASYNSIMETAANIKSLVAGVSASVSDSIFSMQYGLEDNAGKYNMLDVKGARLNDQLRGSNDIFAIAQLAQDQISLINQAWSLLDPEQQKTQILPFEEKLNSIGDFVMQKGADPVALARAQAAETAATIAAAVKAAIDEAMANPTSALSQAAADVKAAASVPAQANISVTVSAPAGSEVSVA